MLLFANKQMDAFKDIELIQLSLTTWRQQKNVINFVSWILQEKKKHLHVLEQPGDTTSCEMINGLLQSKKTCSPVAFKELHQPTDNEHSQERIVSIKTS